MKSVQIGGKLRRIRQERRLTQSQMAAELGISASYLNLIESNRRPVTARVLLEIADKLKIEIGTLAAGDDERLTTDLMEALSDPVFEEHDVKVGDVRELVATLPSVGRVLLALYHAHRLNHGAAPGDLGVAADGKSDASLAVLPSEEVSELIQQRLNHFPELERAAEKLWAENDIALHNLQHDLIRVLAQRYAVQVEIVPAERMPNLLRSYNPLTRRLALSEMLAGPSRTFQLAHQIAMLAHRPQLEQLAGGRLTSPASDALARSALANYFAGAVMMPYGRFIEAARAARYDLDVLQARFSASFEQVCHRLTTLRRPGDEGIPLHLIRVDIAGNISKRFSASGIQMARFGAACPRWNVYDAFATPGMLRVAVSQMPDGQTFFCVARTISSPRQPVRRGGLPQRVENLAIGVGCAVRHARNIVYADGLHLDDPQIVTPIGVSCRTCPRTDCQDRASPALSQKLEIDDNRRGVSPFWTGGGQERG
jgi:predicted transcriptional regulator/transcriptional regulator with XRE-family HTH domain